MNQEANLQKAYMEAYNLACGRLLSCDSQTVCLNANAVFSVDANAYAVRYFGQDCRVSLAGGAVAFEDGAETLPLTEKVLILHYLTHARPVPLTGRHISFNEIPEGGAIYYSNFKKRAVAPLVKTFSENLSGFASAAQSVGGIPERFGDASATVPIFPLVPVTYVIWRGDEEIAPSGTILFDASVTGFLPVEDIVIAASYGVYRMLGEAKKKAETKT